MSLDNNDESPFAKFKKEPAPRSAPPQPADDARVPALEAALRDLKAEFDAYKLRPLPPPPPGPAPQQKTAPELAARLERAEAVIESLRRELALSEERAGARAAAAASKDELKNISLQITDQSAAFNGLNRALSGEAELAARLERAEALMEAQRRELALFEEKAGARAAAAASKDELKNLDLRLTDLSDAFNGLNRSLSGEAELAARADRAEASLAELRTAFAVQQAQVKRSLEALAPRADLEALRANVQGALSGLEDLKRRGAEHEEDFSAIERECHKALGEMQGYVKSAQERPLVERFDEHMKDSVDKLSAKLAEAETAMHAGLAALSGRLNADRVLYEKIFSEAEERIKQGVEPEMKAAEGELRSLRDNVIWLMDEYKIVMARKIRALEGKYSAFEAISARMDSLTGEPDKSSQ